MRSAFSNRLAYLFALPLVAFGAAGCGSDAATECGADGCSDLVSVRMTHLDVQYDLSQPVYLNNRVPVSFGLTAESLDPADPANDLVAVTLSLIDPDAPEGDTGCASNAFNVEVIGDGAEHIYSGFIWPTTTCQDVVGKTLNVQVDFDGGDYRESDMERGIDEPSVSFIAARQGEALNQLCRSDASASVGDGCVYDIALEATPTDENGTLIDIRVAGVAAASSVAVLQDTSELTVDDEPAPLLSVQSVLVVNGRDPYISAVSADEIPEDLLAEDPDLAEDLRFGLAESEIGALTALPGAAGLRYEIAPLDDEGFLPLLVGEERSETVSIESLNPGSPNIFDSELFAEGATLAALEGEWADVESFNVRGCFEADFSQAGNTGDSDPGDCRTFEIMLVREQATSSAASAFEFNRELSKSVGNSRLGLEAYFGTTNRLDSTGATSSIEGRVTISGRIGRSFSFDVARAYGDAHLGTDTASTGYEVGAEAFGQSVLSFSQSAPSILDEREFSQAKSFQLANLGWGFGPVSIGISLSAGGEVFLNTVDSLNAIADGATCADLVGSTDSVPVCGEFSREIEPGFAFTARIEGGVNFRVVKAGVRADLRIVETSFPLTGSLAFGVRDDGAILVGGGLDWNQRLTLIQGDVSIVGKVGFRRWARRLRVHLFSFSSPTTENTLLSQSLSNFEVLD